MSLLVDQITEGTLIRSTHHGYLDVPGHGAMLAHIFPQLRGSLLSSWVDAFGSFGAIIFLVDFIPCRVACK